MQSNRRFNARISGPSREVLEMLRERPGVVYAEQLAERDGDAYTYAIECAPGVDIRKPLFYALAERGWPLIGLEGVGMNIEDIFISIVDGPKKEKSKKRTRKKSAQKASAEQGIAESIIQKNSEKED